MTCQLMGASPSSSSATKMASFFYLPKSWKFTNNKVTFHRTEGALVLMPVRPGKLKLPQPIKKATDYPKTSIK